jgi:hypothetical protein
MGMLTLSICDLVCWALACSAQMAIALTQDDLTEKSGFDGT